LEEKNRIEAIHEKGFDITASTEFRKKSALDDLVVDLGSLKPSMYATLPYRLTKDDIVEALILRKGKTLREISKIFYSFSGIY
jgi:hypothetical protein